VRLLALMLLVLASIGTLVYRNINENSKFDLWGASKPIEPGNKASMNRESVESNNVKGVSTSNHTPESRIGQRINITNFAAPEFDAAWEEAVRAGGSEVDGVYNLSLVVGRMGRIGDPEVILKKITDNFGPGKSRCHLISTLFMASDRIDSLEAAFQKLEFPEELSAACSGISHNLCMVDSPELIDPSKYAFLGSRFNNVFQEALELYVSRFQSKPAAELSIAVGKSIDLQPTKESKLEFLSKIVRIAPFDCWEHLVKNNIELTDPKQRELLSLMFGRDATRAMTRIAEVPGGEKYFSGAFQQWLGNDARKPIEWLEEYKEKLSLTQMDGAMQGIAEFAARKGDTDVAWQWVGKIADPVLRKAAEGKVWSVERSAVRQEVSRGPEAAIQSFLAGTSSHQDYWLQEAMLTWLEKEPEKVQDWYQKNWKTLPANKAQYVAAAFATQAVKQGDTATARQWAAHIQNPKTKQRVEDEIAKAEGQ
jgi:hypothetical protein